MKKARYVAFALAGLFAASAFAGNGTTAAPTPVPAPADQHSGTADSATKRLLLLMDTDQSGKVSKQEFMAYMEAEFDRLDTNKDGELDVKELTQLHVRTNSAIHK